MRNTSISFYWTCIKESCQGHTPFANDWQWVFGSPIWQAFTALPAFAAALASLNAYLGGGTLSTIVQVFIAAFAAYVFTWIVAFFIKLSKAPASKYFAEKERADGLAARLSPKIIVFLNGDGIQVAKTWQAHLSQREPGPLKGPDSKWVQVTLKSASAEIELKNCEVRIERAERIDRGTSLPILVEPILCTWSLAPDAQRSTRMDIPASIPQAANLFSVFDAPSPTLETETVPVKFEFKDEIQRPGTYRLHVAASATGFPTERIAIILNWDGTYENISAGLAG
jgi:hypothetical protein